MPKICAVEGFVGPDARIPGANVGKPNQQADAHWKPALDRRCG
jgi:hypothetical protein